MTLSCGRATAAARRRLRAVCSDPKPTVWTDAPLAGTPRSGYCVGVDAATSWALAAAAAPLNLNAPAESAAPNTMADPSCTPYTIPVTDDNRGVSGKDASFLGNLGAAKDRADESRFVANQFSDVRKDLSDSHDDLARDICSAVTSLSKDVERNGRSAELATEKTAAATILAIEKAAAAAALCCCEVKGAVAASTASILAKMCQDQTDELRRQLTVFQVRAVAGTGSSPV